MKYHFRKAGWLFAPVSLIGWIVTLVYATLCIYVLVAIDSRYNALYPSLIRFFPYFVSFTLIWYWIAHNTSRKD
jgi:F0F1-type ATP synthase assembly protein I